MFENILYQSATALIGEDIKNKRFPGSILLCGPESSGKLSAALETARAVTCSNGASWNCTCSFCMHNKILESSNILLIGASSRTLEISAAKKALLTLNVQNSRHLEAARFLYIRAIRKLTMRFEPVLWEGDDKLSKFSSLMDTITDGLEKIQPGNVLPDNSELKELLDSIQTAAEKLESTYLYKSIPVNQIRNISTWANQTSQEGKRIVIIENADRMSDSTRNALLKILEEPPENTNFILTTTNRSSILPTILSRVRTYTFFERSPEHQKEVIERVFHYKSGLGSEAEYQTVSSYLNSFLPVSNEVIKNYASEFFSAVAAGKVPDIPEIVAGCGNFTPRVLFKFFAEGIIQIQRSLIESPQGAECSERIMEILNQSWEYLNVYNQNPVAVLEEMTRSFMQINFLNKGIFKEVI